MEQRANDTSDNSFTLFFISSIITIAAIVWGYYNYSDIIFTVCIIITILIASFTTFVLTKYKDGYSIDSLHSWYRLGIPFIAIACCVFLIYKLKVELDIDIVSKAKSTDNYLKFSYSDISIEQTKLGLRYSFGLITVMICQIWSFFTFLNYMAEQEAEGLWQAIANITNFFSNYSSVIIFWLLLSLLLILG
jgi:hypothetical protein